jgi:Zn-dependent protease
MGTDHPVQADIPAYAPPAGRQQRRGLAAAAVAAAGLLLKFKPLALTFISTGVTALIYARLFGLAFGVGVVLLILIHESGHLVVARLLRLPVSMPILIPFLGAFVNMRQAPRTVAQEAQMAIGGPILGSIAAGLCYLGHLEQPSTHFGGLLLALAWFGFLINLFNLIPVTPLDGGRVLSVLSKWFNVAGLAIAIGLLLFTSFRSPILILVVLFGAFSTWQRFRSTAVNPAYFEVSPQARWTIGALYLALLIALAFGLEQTRGLLPVQ